MVHKIKIHQDSFHHDFHAGFRLNIVEKYLDFYQKILNKGGKDKKRYIACKTMVVLTPAFS